MSHKGHIESLDALRGIAAIIVVIHHRYFFFLSPGTTEFDIASLALSSSSLAGLFYVYGLWAVDLFFCLSGFIFFYKYGGMIANRSITPWTFAVLRLSRLYPLHLATLLAVCVLQSLYFNKHGAFLVYQTNDIMRFVLQLGLISNWWPTSPLSFNGPIWSVSIEVFLYMLFFAIARYLVLSERLVATVAVIGVVVMFISPNLGRGIVSFYMGGMVYQFAKTQGSRERVTLVWWMGYLILIVVAAMGGKYSGTLGWVGWGLTMFIFPALIATLALADRHISPFASAFRWLGNISYSSYLLHFPLILLIVDCGLARPQSRLFFFLFVALVLGMSFICYHYFERPLQHWLRKHLLASGSAD